jgi:polyribonucleotide nucleotidyltransferase
MENPMETLRELWEICECEMRKRGEKIQENLTRRDIYYERLRGIQKTYRKIRNGRSRGGTWRSMGATGISVMRTSGEIQRDTRRCKMEDPGEIQRDLWKI